MKQSTFYVAAMAAFAVISACYTNIAISMAFNRDAGILKRTGDAVARLVVPGGRVLHAMFVALILVAINVAFGSPPLRRATSRRGRSRQFAITLLVGAA